MISTLTNTNQKTMKEITEEMIIRKTNECFIFFPLGSQYDHLILQAVNRLGVFCLLADPAKITAADVKKINPKGIILSGGPASVIDNPPPFDCSIFDLHIPTLGICLGFQLWAKHLGVEITHPEKREFGIHTLSVTRPQSRLFKNLPPKLNVLESHGDRVEPDNILMLILASTDNAPAAAASYSWLWGVQFHPEVPETEYGDIIFNNFCFDICQAKDHFPAPNVADIKIQELKEQIGENKVVLALSAGCDSSTVAYLLKNALGENSRQTRAIYIKGIDRDDDEKYVLKYFSNLPWLDLKIIDATDRFLPALAGIETMKEKRLAMRDVYKQILEEEAKEFKAKFIIQGTLYTDITESGGGHESGAKKAMIKQHHNTNLNFIYEELTPLDDQVKDTGRAIGTAIGVPDELLHRHPFPGPGLIIRIEGLITAEKLKIARQADSIFIEELRRNNLYDDVWQAGVIVTDSMTTCTKGDDAVSGRVIVLRAVNSVNGHTARWFEFQAQFQRHISTRLFNEILEVGRVLYDISDKPGATIEWG